jgi:outer membrane protein OmpA-like peptidoglycan-associated protein
VRINGYTDVLGTETYNEELSRNRAIETAKALGLPTSAVLGLGEQRPLYPNDLPEGRAYNRTVTVTVETPVK